MSAISQLPAVTPAGTDRIPLARLSGADVYTANTISAAASDNSLNDSAASFPGWLVPDLRINIADFTGDTGNNHDSAVIVTATTSKVVLRADTPLVDDAAGESVTITAWESVSAEAQDVADLAAPGGSMSSAEEEHWHKLAALLDPDAYVYAIGAAWSITVPANKVYYLVSAWRARLGSTGNDFYLRDPRQPMPMLPGFNLQSNGHASAHYYYCDPSLVTYADPKEKYFERLASLVDLQQYILGATMASGQAQGTTASATFPTDFTNGLLLAAQSFDVAWVALGAAGGNILNLDDEISDDHQNRVAGGMMPFLLPFKRTTFAGIVTRGGNTAGTATTTIAGNASISYVKTPVGW
jgi:hypothetical protein